MSSQDRERPGSPEPGTDEETVSSLTSDASASTFHSKEELLLEGVSLKRVPDNPASSRRTSDISVTAFSEGKPLPERRYSEHVPDGATTTSPLSDGSSSTPSPRAESAFHRLRRPRMRSRDRARPQSPELVPDDEANSSDTSDSNVAPYFRNRKKKLPPGALSPKRVPDNSATHSRTSEVSVAPLSDVGPISGGRSPEPVPEAAATAGPSSHDSRAPFPSAENPFHSWRRPGMHFRDGARLRSPELVPDDERSPTVTPKHSVSPTHSKDLHGVDLADPRDAPLEHAVALYDPLDIILDPKRRARLEQERAEREAAFVADLEYYFERQDNPHASDTTSKQQALESGQDNSTCCCGVLPLRTTILLVSILAALMGIALLAFSLHQIRTGFKRRTHGLSSVTSALLAGPSFANAGFFLAALLFLGLSALGVFKMHPATQNVRPPRQVRTSYVAFSGVLALSLALSLGLHILALTLLDRSPPYTSSTWATALRADPARLCRTEATLQCSGFSAPCPGTALCPGHVCAACRDSAPTAACTACARGFDFAACAAQERGAPSCAQRLPAALAAAYVAGTAFAAPALATALLLTGVGARTAWWL